jgi:hypothetical protein
MQTLEERGLSQSGHSVLTDFLVRFNQFTKTSVSTKSHPIGSVQKQKPTTLVSVF